ncbi:MAG: hypothetical protein U5L11_03240 [Arhodomonas sp.]|nr:hypothetical protein [Arhodomonas sp.]
MLVIILALLPLMLTNPYHYDVAIHVLINAVVVVGLNLLIGYAGQISLGHAGFFGLGAYWRAGVLSGIYGWHPLLSILAALVVVAALAFVVARPILRLSGHYLAMATLGLGILIDIVTVHRGLAHRRSRRHDRADHLGLRLGAVRRDQVVLGDVGGPGHRRVAGDQSHRLAGGAGAAFGTWLGGRRSGGGVVAPLTTRC